MEQPKNININIDDMERLESSRNREVSRNATFLVDLWYEDEKFQKELQSLFSLFNNVANSVISDIVKNGLYVSTDDIIANNLLTFVDIPTKKSDFYPFIVYVAAAKSDRNTIGIKADMNGNYEIFEGNEEASDQTYAAVNRLVGNDKEVVVYGSHGSSVIEHIQQTKTLPDGLYVSLDKRRASGYWGEDRYLFKATVNQSYLREESRVDFKVIGNAPVKKFKLL